MLVNICLLMLHSKVTNVVYCPRVGFCISVRSDIFSSVFIEKIVYFAASLKVRFTCCEFC